MASITKLPSGKWRAQIRKSGIYKASTFDRRADASAWAAEVEASISSATGTVRPTPGMTLARVIQAYLSQVDVGRSTTATLTRISKGSMGQINVGKLTALHMSDFIAQRRKDGVTGATLACDLSSLSAVLKWARRVKQIDLNERLAAEARSSLTAARIDTRSHERDRLPTDDELARIRVWFSSNPRMEIPMVPIIDFALASAMRLSEITAIRVEDVSWNRSAVLIRQRKDPRRKLRNDQLVPMPPDAMEILRTAAQGRAEGYLFPFEAASIGAAWQRACKALNITDLHFHDLRHAAITGLFGMGLDIPVVAQVSGHRDWRHLQRYTNLTPEHFHNAFQKSQNRG